ncbi:CapA family protein [Epilithonimonas zeae]|uniref:CapA family protein n=1 Tax=Epilithonimonas zeae TaxID=1416779 RepID=UPI00200D78C4|nr:CapA family protein [Epilithonimonas zeae]UQB67444.1 CapA family protein [Epilithonimonas zeae]
MSSIEIFISGDFCPINRIESLIDKRDYEAVLNDVLPILQNVDLAITNLECPLTDSKTPIKKVGAAIKAKVTSVNLLKIGNFGLVTLANNHILDYGEEGIKSTLEVCEENHINTVGAGLTLKDAEKVFITEIKSKKIGFYNLAENEFGNTYGEKAGANPLDPVKNSYDIKKAKSQCDFLFVIVHGGREHYQLPSPRVQELYRFFADCGADAVVAHHTHCYSGYELYNNVPIFYSLGNFIFDYKKKYQKGTWTQGYGVIFKLLDDNLQFEIVPFNQGREQDPTLRLLNASEKEIFDKKLNDFNRIISNSGDLQNSWDDYITTQELSYKSNLLIQNKYVRELIRRKYLPEFFLHSDEHKLLLLNLLRCETHREILIDVLTKSN